MLRCSRLHGGIGLHGPSREARGRARKLHGIRPNGASPSCQVRTTVDTKTVPADSHSPADSGTLRTRMHEMFAAGGCALWCIGSHRRRQCSVAMPISGALLRCECAEDSRA